VEPSASPNWKMNGEYESRAGGKLLPLCSHRSVHYRRAFLAYRGVRTFKASRREHRLKPSGAKTIL
jgi:hypothetical protein